VLSGPLASEKELKAATKMIRLPEPFEKFQEYLEKKLDEARTSLMFQDGIQPLLITWEANGVGKEVPLQLTPESKEEDASLIRSACKSPQTIMAAIIFDSYTYFAETAKIHEIRKELEEKEATLKDIDGSQEAIFIFLYTKDQTFSRSVSYKKRGTQDYWFADEGWDGVPDANGLFANPFQG